MIRARLRALWPDFAVVLAYLILPLLLYAGVTLGPRTMLPADNLFQWPPWQASAAEFDATPPHNALIGDLVIQNYAWKRFVNTSLAGGEIPLWNPYLFAGAPFLANGQHSALYPFSILFLILPLAKAYGWFVLSQVWLAGVAMYLFGRVLGMQRGSAALAGFVYQGGQYLIISAAVFPMIAAAVVWLPLLLAAIEKVVTTAMGPPGGRGRAILWATAGAILLACQVLAGHAEFTYYTLLVMGLYAFWRLLTQWQYLRSASGATESPEGEHAPRPTSLAFRAAGWLAAMVAVGLLIASLQLAPLFEVGRVNFREGSASYEEVLGWAYPLRGALTFALPNFYGNPTHHAVRDAFTGRRVPVELNHEGGLNPYGPYTTSWGTKNYVEGATYLGILPLLLALVGLAALLRWRALPAARSAHLWFMAALSFFSLAFIFGTPLYALLYYGLPFINQLHTPFRWVFPLALAVAVLVGFGADEIADVREAYPPSAATNRTRRFVHLLSMLALATGVLVLGLTLISRFSFASFRPLVERLFLGLAGASFAFPSAESFYSYLFWQLLLLGGLLVASGVVLWLACRSRLWVWLACGLIILDLFLASVGFNAAVDPALLEFTPAAVQWLNDQPGEWRITTYDPNGAGTLNANTPWLNDLPDIRGYDSIIPRQFTDYMGVIEPQNGLPFNRVQPIGSPAALESPLLDVLAVKYVITTEEIESPKFRPVWEGEGVVIYENLGVAPRAYLLPQTAEIHAANALAALTEYDPRRYVVIEGDDATVGAAEPGELRPATIDSSSNNEVVVRAAVNEPAWLILSDSYFPGWRAYVRPAGSDEDAETEVDIALVNGNFRGVRLPPGDADGPGEWIVRFRYSPRSFQLGGLMSFMGLTVLAFGLSVWIWRRFYRPESTATTTRSIAKNSAAPMALNLFNKGIDFVFAAFYLRFLGPADSGSFATAIATAGIFEIVANYGLNILLIRDVSQDRGRAGTFLFNSSLLRIATAVVAALPIIAYVLVTSQGPNPLSTDEVTAIILMMIGMVISGWALGVAGLFYVHEEAEVPAAMSTVTTILKVGLGVAVLLAGFGFVGLAAVSIVVNLVTLLLLLVPAARRFDLRGPWALDRGMLQEMARLGFPLMLIHLLQTIFISIDVLLLRQLLPNGETVVGWYNSAWKWFNALQIIPSYFTLALFPVISRAIMENMDTARRMYRMSLKLMLLLALPIAALTTFAAPLLIGLLGGSEFLPQGAVALQVIIWSIPFGWLNSVTNYVLIALGLERMQPRAFVLAVGFNVIFNWIFIPRYSFVAAGIITIMSEMVLMAIFAYYLRQKNMSMDWLRLVVRPALLTALMIGVMWLGVQVHLFVGLGLGVVVYLGGLIALRIIEPDERAAMAALMPGALARRLGWAGE